MAQMLIEMAHEEVAELLEGIDVDASGMAMAALAIEMVKSDTALMEKVGARNSKADTARIQAVHDHSMALGAKCDSDNCEDDDGEADKAVEASFTKLLETGATQIEALNTKIAERDATIADQGEKLAKAVERIERLEKLPRMDRGRPSLVERESEGVSDDPLVKLDDDLTMEKVAAMPPGRDKQRAILFLQARAGIGTRPAV
jgi:hypothetical protein